MAMTTDCLEPLFITTTASSYRIETAKKDRLPDVLKFLRKHYHEEEKITRMLKAGFEINEEEALLIQDDDDNLTAASYEQSPCLIAVENGTEEVVGVILTTLSRREDVNEENGPGTAELFKSHAFKSKFNKYLYDHLIKIDESAGIYKKYPDAEAILEFSIVAVHKKHRRKGLAEDLSRGALRIAKRIPGVRVVFGLYSSIYSRKVAEKIGMVHLCDIDLRDIFKNDDGESVFDDVDGDCFVSVMALEIDHGS